MNGFSVERMYIRKGRKRKDSLVRGRNRWGGAAIEWWVW
jgi:hypothetical protein